MYGVHGVDIEFAFPDGFHNVFTKHQVLLVPIMNYHALGAGQFTGRPANVKHAFHFLVDRPGDRDVLPLRQPDEIASISVEEGLSPSTPS